jgi:hypothetical protein
MKSIKEKSFELFPEMQTDSDDWDVIEEQCDRDDQRKAFVLGANYVLDEIETIIKADLGSYKSQLDRIKNIIEQLKK